MSKRSPTVHDEAAERFANQIIDALMRHSNWSTEQMAEFARGLAGDVDKEVGRDSRATTERVIAEKFVGKDFLERAATVVSARRPGANLRRLGKSPYAAAPFIPGKSEKGLRKQRSQP